MTLLQLMENREGKPILLACETTDYPDMPMRGVLWLVHGAGSPLEDEHRCGSTGYPTTPEKRQSLIGDRVQKCQSLNISSFRTS